MSSVYLSVLGGWEGRDFSSGGSPDGMLFAFNLEQWLDGRHIMLPVPLPLRVLVVDDNRDAADTLSDLLRIYGADVRARYNSEAALELIREFEFDAAVLDIHMPGLDGCELARRLRETAVPRRILLVALTGVSDDAARHRTTEAGFDLHLTKSSAPDVLFAALAAFARWLRENESSASPRPLNGTSSAT